MLLLSLVGEQPIPNLLPLWQFPQYDAVQFACTETTRPVAKALHDAICCDPQLQRLQVLEPIAIPAYAIGTARQALAAALLQHLQQNRPVTLNLTGGTKLMSLAALQAAYGTGVSLLYVSTEENQVIRLASDGAEQERLPLRVNITVEQYLRAHGLEVSQHQSFQPNRPAPASPPTEGSHLEDRVYHLLSKSRRFDDVRRRLHIRKQLNNNSITNELDLTATLNGRLAVCSCKSGKVTNEALYELASLSRREAAGIYCGKVMIIENPNPSAILRDRARSMGIKLVYGAEIANVANHVLLACGQKPS